MKTITTTIVVYDFDELSPKAKERARDWYREAGLDYEWWDFIYGDAKAAFSKCGFTIDKIFFSGFSSQGDGAMFEGSWKAEDYKPGAMFEYAPTDRVLGMIAIECERISKMDPSAFMSVIQSGRYSHEGCTLFNIKSDVEGVEERIKEVSREAMRWIYSQLSAEYDYLRSNESVDDSILSNEYTFTIDGKREG